RVDASRQPRDLSGVRVARRGADAGDLGRARDDRRRTGAAAGHPRRAQARRDRPAALLRPFRSGVAGLDRARAPRRRDTPRVSIARENGTYAMVAMDQRESLRTMLREHGHDDSDERVRMFKTAVARELAPHASGFLIEPEFVEDVKPLVP